MPQFIVAFERILEAERQAELERLAKIPIYYLSPAHIRRKELREKRRLQKHAAEDTLPEWFVNPSGCVKEESEADQIVYA